MPKTVSIPLAEPITEHGKVQTHITLREPVWSDVMGHGPPYAVHMNAEGRPFLVYDEPVIAHYATALLVDTSALLVEDADLRAAMAVREAICGFFLDAARATDG